MCIRDSYNSGRLLLSLINDILDLSKIEAGKFDLVEEPVDVGTVIQRSLHQIEGMAEQADLRLEADVPEDLPPMVGDERALAQVLNNLLSNAVKFTPSGGLVTCQARLGEEKGIQIWVTDMGIGMSEEDIAQALVPFEQVDGTRTRQHEGSGLGLHLSMNLMKLFGGTLDLSSKVGEGTTVVLSFPAGRTRSAC